MNFPNQKESDDYKDWYNPDKKPDPGAYAQVKADPNAALREHGNNYENANQHNLSGRKDLLDTYNSADVMRQSTNAWVGNRTGSGNADYTGPTKTVASEHLA